MTALTDRSAAELLRELADGGIQAMDLLEACLARIAEREPAIEAWAFLDPEAARAQARAADDRRASGQALGPLHGLPVGVKDIIDTADFPTENGTPLDAGRRPEEDAALVARLREAGGFVLGKTVTTELAFYTPGKTRNPRDPKRTPGGSSSGSAAAVAAGMVPLAVGTQTGGSVIRPAAFCGIVGFKPSRDLISRDGVLQQSQSLDTVGVFGRDVADVALLAACLAGWDRKDPTTPSPAGEPRFAFVRSPVWHLAEQDTRDGFEGLVSMLDDACEAVDLPAVFNTGHDVHRTLMLRELADNYETYAARGWDQLSPQLQAAIEEGRGIAATAYRKARDSVDRLTAGLADLFSDYDAILTPAAPGVAPAGLETTGDPAFCALWTLCGTPAITLPLLQGVSGLPMGVQLVGRRGNDAGLLRAADWLEKTHPKP